MKIRFSIMLVTFILGYTLVAPASAARPTKLTLNGQPLSDIQLTYINDYAYIPAREIFELLGCAVVFDSESQKVAALSLYDGSIIEFVINGEATVNSENLPLDAPALVVSGRTMVPLRFVDKALRGVIVDYDKKSNSVLLTNYDSLLTTLERTYQSDSFKILKPINWTQTSSEDNNGSRITKFEQISRDHLNGLNEILIYEIQNKNPDISIEQIDDINRIVYLEDMTTPLFLLSKDTIEIKENDAIISELSFECTINKNNIPFIVPLKIYKLTISTPNKVFVLLGLWADPQTKHLEPVIKEAILSFEPVDAQE